ncbi:amino acid lyase, partial [Streptococcus suis]
KYTESAIEKIRLATYCTHAEVTYLAGVTQNNQIVISSMLDSYEGVIAADTCHIAVHEAGAIEFTGHNVLALPHTDGKLV